MSLQLVAIVPKRVYLLHIGKAYTSVSSCTMALCCILMITQTYQSGLPFFQDRASYTAPFERERQTYDVAISDMPVEFGCPGTNSTRLSSITFLRLGSFVGTPFSAYLSKEFITLTINSSFISQNFKIRSLTFHF
jgi:hypothetical protein